MTAESIRKELAIVYRLWRDVRYGNQKALAHYSRAIIRLRAELATIESAK